MNDLIPYQFPFVSQPESPETAIARSDAEIAADTLKNLSQKVLYKNLSEDAKELGRYYLNCLTQLDSPTLKESSDLDIHVEMIRNRGIEKIFFGEEERGFVISIKLR